MAMSVPRFMPQRVVCDGYRCVGCKFAVVLISVGCIFVLIDAVTGMFSVEFAGAAIVVFKRTV